jgi:hypothetical protein
MRKLKHVDVQTPEGELHVEAYLKTPSGKASKIDPGAG